MNCAIARLLSSTHMSTTFAHRKIECKARITFASVWNSTIRDGRFLPFSGLGNPRAILQCSPSNRLLAFPPPTNKCEGTQHEEIDRPVLVETKLVRKYITGRQKHGCTNGHGCCRAVAARLYTRSIIGATAEQGLSRPPD